jgi:hypothetical protein
VIATGAAAEHKPLYRRVPAFESLHEDARRAFRRGVERQSNGRGQESGLRRQPRNRALADIELPGQVSLRRRAVGKGFQRLTLLVRGKLGRSPHVDASRPGANAAFASARADQLALELGKSAKHREHQAPVRRCGVRPCVAKRADSGTGLRNRVDDVQEVAGGPRKPVEARDKQRVACIEGFDGARQLAPVGPGSARRLTKHGRGSGGGQRRNLSVERLPVRAYPRIAVNRHATVIPNPPLMQVYFA